MNDKDEAAMQEDPAFPKGFRFLWRFPEPGAEGGLKGRKTWWLIVLGTWFQALFDLDLLTDCDYEEATLTMFTHKPFGFHRITLAWRWK